MRPLPLIWAMIWIQNPDNKFIENIVCNGAKKPISISGLKAMPLHHVYLKNISIQTKGSVEIENAENIFQENINILEKH